MNIKSFSVCLLLSLLLLSMLPHAGADPLTVSTDKAEYHRGETVSISISNAPPNCDLGVQISNPVGGVVFIAERSTDNQGRASVSFKIPPDATYGTYTIYVAGCGDAGSARFSVTEIAPPPPPPAKKTSSIIITVNKTTVILGESIMVSGTLSPALNTVVHVKVTCPNGTEVLKYVLASDGEFNYVFKPDVAGIWSVKAYWPGNDEYQDCMSKTLTLAVRGPVSLQVFVAPLMTNVGGTIIVYVTTSPPLADKTITVSYTTNKTAVWSLIGVFQMGSTGTVTLLFTPSETGKYVFKAEWIGDQTFMPASASSSEVLVTAEPLTVEDITNMMSQLKALREQLEEKEEELKSCRDAIAGLQKDLGDLQAELSSAQSRISSLESQLSETRSLLAEAESRVQFTSILGVVAGVLIGLIIGYLVFRRRSGTSGFAGLPAEQ